MQEQQRQQQQQQQQQQQEYEIKARSLWPSCGRTGQGISSNEALRRGTYYNPQQFQQIPQQQQYQYPQQQTQQQQQMPNMIMANGATGGMMMPQPLHLGGGMNTMNQITNAMQNLHFTTQQQQQVMMMLQQQRQEIMMMLHEQKQEMLMMLQEQNQQKDALQQGTYYTTISDLWYVRAESPRADYFARFCRDGGGNLRVGPIRNSQRGARAREELVPAYALTIDPVLAERDRISCMQCPAATIVPVEEPEGSDTSSHDQSLVPVDGSIWPSDIYAFVRTLGVPLAHFVPASQKNAMTWWFIPDFVFGVQQWTWNERDMLINGFRDNKDGSNKQPHTGITHMTTNNVMIPGQFFFETNPCLLLVPIMSIERARNWSGEAYDAIVVIDGWDDADVKLQNVAHETNMDEKGWGPNATVAEIDQAGGLLRKSLLAIRHALLHPPADMPVGFYDEFRELEVPRAAGSSLVEVPFRRKDDKPRVRKVCFAAATDWSDEVRDGYNQPVTVDDDDIRRHMAPDPILVVSKAAAIFAARHHQKFAAGAEPEEEDLLDTLAHEQFWESLQATLRPPEDRTELARALGQLHDTQDPKM